MYTVFYEENYSFSVTGILVWRGGIFSFKTGIPGGLGDTHISSGYNEIYD